MDDSLPIGNEEGIKAVIKDIQNPGFKLKIEGKLDDYLSCEISFNDNKTMAWLKQPHLLKKIEDKFGRLVNKLQEYKTPGSQGITVL